MVISIPRGLRGFRSSSWQHNAPTDPRAVIKQPAPFLEGITQIKRVYCLRLEGPECFSFYLYKKMDEHCFLERKFAWHMLILILKTKKQSPHIFHHCICTFPQRFGRNDRNPVGQSQPSLRPIRGYSPTFQRFPNDPGRSGSMTVSNICNCSRRSLTPSLETSSEPRENEVRCWTWTSRHSPNDA